MAASSEQPIRDLIAGVQDRIAAAFGIEPADREQTVAAMLHRGREAAGYWLQLLLAMGIATLGLILGSTAAVIGAMLISPLMSPIVELGMGLATGSPLLVMRSFARTAVSIAVVIACATALTLAMPFTEETPEIAARTAPTALDLLIAIFCAIAAAYTTVRAGSDKISTAAGTAIGISLVPPLCVVGYGIGTTTSRIAGGAALLFTANFCAILLVAVLCFLLVGYGLVGIGALERAELAHPDDDTAIRKVARALQSVFISKYGPALRVLMPLLLVAAVYAPLRRALIEVTWEVRSRAAIQKMFASLPQAAVRSSVTLEHHTVIVRLVTLGRAEDAAKLERELADKIADATGVVPTVDVIAVPDATALEAVAMALDAKEVAVAAPAPGLDVGRVRDDLSGAIARAWPTPAGPLLRWRIVFPESGPLTLELVHAGSALGEAGTMLLGQAIAKDIGAEVAVRDVPISLEPIVAEPGAGLTWLSAALRALQPVDDLEPLWGCVEVPKPPKGGPSKDTEAITAALRATPAFREGRMHLGEGPRWRAVVATSPCSRPAEPLPDGGAPK
ncbi:DUF389 domain-containing protein [Polyangium aurulentum]|uniref:DUF389 domain-containing protein n=1 Tax=Polyangium aurulentum TaxID=2567896 RepID=UPI0010ADBF66|nr:DUF389 domain-containing protein [Polyangium aurulentum]UQA58547.1 DUF389 domain-containing protein [Polyangium aurulentum]